MRIVGLVVAMLVCAARPADACGYWRMHDAERGVDVGYLINSAEVKQGEKRLATFYLDIENKDGLRVVTSKTVIFDFKGDKLRKLGKPVATVDWKAGTVAFGKRVYRIDLVPNPKAEHEMPEWFLTVTRGDVKVLESEHASALCAPMHKDPPMTDDELQAEVRRRVIFYLAFREVGLS